MVVGSNPAAPTSIRMKMKINTEKPYKIYAEVLEQGALDQFESAMQQNFAVKGALMPDAHTGYSLPIGAVVATDNFILPAWVGYDIGCGMCAVQTSFKLQDVLENRGDIFQGLYAAIPVGFNHNKKDQQWDGSERLSWTEKLDEIFAKNGLKQLGTLGGGNHFIEIGYDEDKMIWFIIHSGSRGIGHAVASYYMRLASGDGKAREGHFGFKADSENGQAYAIDLNFCLEFALENRKQIMRRIESVVNLFCDGECNWPSLINRNHNHAELKDGMWIHRKGATHAENRMLGVIPGNMRDGSFIVQGKGNPDALWSSSHGAGRVMGRKEAKRKLDIEDFKSTMGGVTALVNPDTLDESPFAYKDIFEVMKLQSSLVDIIAHVKPIINIKG